MQILRLRKVLIARRRSGSLSNFSAHMASTDPRVDEYIATIAPWQQAILQRFRSLIHKACPSVNESIKWSRPAFDYKGIVCGISGFKHYCSMGFWKESILKESAEHQGVLEAVGKVHEGEILPPDAAILALLREAVRLNEEGVKVLTGKDRAEKKPLSMPQDFEKTLLTNAAAQAAFENFPPSAQRDYIQWIEDAKTEATRKKRMITAIEWIAEGKHRHWKYQTKK